MPLSFLRRRPETRIDHCEYRPAVDFAELLDRGATVVAQSRRACENALAAHHAARLVLAKYRITSPSIVGGSDAMQTAPTRQKPLVLIAEDNWDTAEMLAVYLDMIGYEVEIAGNGREAIEKATSLRPNLIVMDLEMPDIDGWKAIAALRGDSRTATIPVIVLTGHHLS